MSEKTSERARAQLTDTSAGAIAGIVIGVVVGVALLVVLAIFLLKKLDFDSKRQLFSRTKIHAAESSVPMVSSWAWFFTFADPFSSKCDPQSNGYAKRKKKKKMSGFH